MRTEKYMLRSSHFKKVHTCTNTHKMAHIYNAHIKKYSSLTHSLWSCALSQQSVPKAEHAVLRRSFPPLTSSGRLRPLPCWTGSGRASCPSLSVRHNHHHFHHYHRLRGAAASRCDIIWIFSGFLYWRESTQWRNESKKGSAGVCPVYEKQGVSRRRKKGKWRWSKRSKGERYQMRQ